MSQWAAVCGALTIRGASGQRQPAQGANPLVAANVWELRVSYFGLLRSDGSQIFVFGSEFTAKGSENETKRKRSEREAKAKQKRK
jgi:hypothetical protein